MTAYTFDYALPRLKSGQKFRRKGWNGLGMYIYLVKHSTIDVEQYSRDTDPLVGLYGEGQIIKYADRFDMRYTTGVHGIWTPTHEDILASDWEPLT